MMKYKSKQLCITNIRKIFNGKGNKVTLDEVFTAWNRPLDQVEKNKMWFSNLLSHLKHHNLVIPIYDIQNSRRVLTGIKLSTDGLFALGRMEWEPSNGPAQQPLIQEAPTVPQPARRASEKEKLNFLEVAAMVERLQEENPEFEISLTVKKREENK